MAIREALTQLTDMIQSSTPPSEETHRFVSVDDADGISTDIYERSGNMRLFDIKPAQQQLPIDDGDAGLSGRKRSHRVIRVRYDLPHDETLRTNIVSEDVTHLIDTIKGPDYQPATSSITTVLPGSPSYEILYAQDGNPIAWLVLIPIDILFKN